jgi:hypothetical protein
MLSTGQETAAAAQQRRPMVATVCCDGHMKPFVACGDVCVIPCELVVIDLSSVATAMRCVSKQATIIIPI